MKLQVAVDKLFSHKLFSNKYFLYAVVATSVLTNYMQIVDSHYEIVGFFILVGIIMMNFSKNVAVVLTVCLLLTQIIMAGRCVQEGLNNMPGKLKRKGWAHLKKYMKSDQLKMMNEYKAYKKLKRDKIAKIKQDIAQINKNVATENANILKFENQKTTIKQTLNAAVKNVTTAKGAAREKISKEIQNIKISLDKINKDIDGSKTKLISDKKPLGNLNEQLNKINNEINGINGKMKSVIETAKSAKAAEKAKAAAAKAAAAKVAPSAKPAAIAAAIIAANPSAKPAAIAAAIVAAKPSAKPAAIAAAIVAAKPTANPAAITAAIVAAKPTATPAAIAAAISSKPAAIAAAKSSKPAARAMLRAIKRKGHQIPGRRGFALLNEEDTDMEDEDDYEFDFMGPSDISGLTQGTTNLMTKQKDLFSFMNSMTPLIENAKKMLGGLDLTKLRA